MGRIHLRRSLRKYHIWLGWLIGVPMLFWTLSGVVMVWKPIGEVRGADLMAAPAPLALIAPPVAPRVAGRPLVSLALETRAAGPRWVIRFVDGGSRMADPASGALLPPLSAAEAVREVTGRYTGTARVASVTRTDPAHPPLELRREITAWRVRMSDGTHFYVDADSGVVTATRTRFWRFYDWMWGLHIMDLQTREDTHNPWIVGFGLATLVTTILALILLPLTGKPRRNGRPVRAQATPATAPPARDRRR